MRLGGRTLYWGNVIAGSIVVYLGAVSLAGGRLPKEFFGVCPAGDGGWWRSDS